METDLCIHCKKGTIYIKKRKLCLNCYHTIRNISGPFRKNVSSKTKGFALDHQHRREIEFLRNFFDHSNWIYQPCTFRLGNEGTYTPDFYDGVRHVFIEVSGSRQAYHANKEKYKLFRETFPKTAFEIRKANGGLLDEAEDKLNWN